MSDLPSKPERDYATMKLETVKLLALAGDEDTRYLAVQELYRRASRAVQ